MLMVRAHIRLMGAAAFRAYSRLQAGNAAQRGRLCGRAMATLTVMDVAARVGILSRMGPVLVLTGELHRVHVLRQAVLRVRLYMEPQNYDRFKGSSLLRHATSALL